MPGNLIYYALVLIVIALVAALLGFGGVAGTAMSGAHLLLWVAVVIVIVGVVLDTMRQVETHLLQRHYDGFLRKGKIRGAREQRPRLSSGQVLDDSSLVLIYTSLGILVIAGVTIFFAPRQ